MSRISTKMQNQIPKLVGQLYNNNSNSSRPYYYIFGKNDPRGLYRLRLNFKHHKFQQRHCLRFTKNSRGFGTRYVHHSNIMSLLKIAMFEYLGRCVANLGDVLIRNRQRIRSCVAEVRTPSQDGTVWYQGEMYQECIIHDPLTVHQRHEDSSWIDDCVPVIKYIRHEPEDRDECCQSTSSNLASHRWSRVCGARLPERVNLLRFAEYVKVVVCDGDDDSVVALNHAISRTVAMTNEILSIYSLIAKKDSLSDALEYVNAALMPTLYDFEFVIGLMRWKH